jgi:hypothetical protein
MLCAETEFTQEEAVMLMDHCPAHVTQDILRILLTARVCVGTFPSQTTKIFQVLDLTLFIELF